MAHNSYVRPGGAWNPNQVVRHDEFAALDLGQFRSINGDDGGTWAPSSPIGIYGAGVSMRLVSVSTVTTGAELTFSSGSTLELQTGSLASFSGDMEFAAGSYAHIENGGWIRWRQGSQLEVDTGAFVYLNGTVSVGSTGSFGCQAPAVFSGTVSEFTGTALFTALCQFASTTTVLFQGNENHVGSANFSGSLSIAADTSLTNKVTTSGAGRVVKRTAFIASTGSNTNAYGPSNCDRILVQALTAEIRLTINDTDAVDGEELDITNLSADYFVRVCEPSGGNFASLKNAPTQMRTCKAIRYAGQWRFFSGSNY